jgi:hypothetical protein
MKSPVPINESESEVMISFIFHRHGSEELRVENFWVPKSVDLNALSFPVTGKYEFLGDARRTFRLTAITGIKLK